MNLCKAAFFAESNIYLSKDMKRISLHILILLCYTCLTVCALSGVPPPGPGVMVMQLSVPNGPQPSQNPPLVQWNPCKYYSIEQRASKPGELYKPDNTPQVHACMQALLINATNLVNSICNSHVRVCT